MPSGHPGAGQIRFGSFEFDPRSLELRRSGRPVRLAPQPAHVLGTLLARPGEMVTREELRQELWSHDTFVDFEAGLNYCLGRLRAVLGDDARKPTFIETLPRRGYRFVAPLERLGVTPRTLAVLPFDNIGGDPAQDFVADGVADGLITELGKLRGLRVISRQSVLGFKGSTLRMAEIAQRLHADTVLEGSVLQRGNRLRITAQLIEVHPERHLWAESYEGDPQDFMDVLVRVARAVAAAICVVLGPEDETRMRAAADASAPRYKPDAQTAFLKARFHLGKWSAAEFQQALTLFHQAIALDPTHAPAHAALASCLSLLGYNGHAPWRVVYPQAKLMAERAAQLDGSSSAAQSSLGFVKLVYDWDFWAADACFRRAIEANPSNEWALLTRALFQLWVEDDLEGALDAVDMALVIDPVSPFTNSMAAWLMLMAFRYDESAAQAERTLQMYQDAHQALTALAWTRVASGEIQDGVAMFERAAAASPDEMTLGFLGHAYALAGRRDEARRLLDRLIGADPAGHACIKSIVGVLAGLGDFDRAFEWIDRGIVERDGGLLSAQVSPPFVPLFTDPRFQAAVERMGLPPRRHRPPLR
jgi:TolB-like protein/tetratricopeptide (TPR) repeat protein